MSQSTAYTQTPLTLNFSGNSGSIGSNATPVWLQIALAGAGVLALIWFFNRKKGSA